ncbi:MAG: twin-arginine translocase TatA/TatE family subunit [Pedosphaera sp. Tous-C6FEB]|nr:MAG: twin-arginine translocase TatA/TatE family subunit [Pedosphaera sp. Tous-C6FEB]
MLAMLGWPEIIGILVVVLILFGAKKLPELAKGLGQGIKEFKKASSDMQNELHRSVAEEQYAAPPKPAPAPQPASAPAPAPAPQASQSTTAPKA